MHNSNIPHDNETHSTTENTNDEEFMNDEETEDEEEIEDDLGYKASDLYGVELPDTVWAVPDVLPEGLNILTGDQKRGKSFLALDLGLSVSSGKPWLEKFPTQQGTVLYFALEDNKKKIQTRLYGDPCKPEDDYLHATQEDTENIHVYHELTDLQHGALDIFQALYKKYHPSLIVIDTLVYILPSSKGNAYKDEYKHLKKLENFGLENHVCILALHHTNKSKGHVDPFERVNGSRAMTGATEVNLFLERGLRSPQGTLHIQSRVAESDSWLLDMSHVKAKYRGNAEEENLSEARKAIKQTLLENGPMTAREVSSELDTRYNTTRNTMQKMLKDNQLIKVGAKYSLPYQS